MKKVECIGVNTCLRPRFQEWYDEKCSYQQDSITCGTYKDHGLGFYKICTHGEGPKRGLRTVTMQDLADLNDHDGCLQIAYLSCRAEDAIQEFKNDNTE